MTGSEHRFRGDGLPDGNEQLLEEGCRVAFAALMRDLGKLARRGRIFDQDERGDAVALTLEALEPYLPDLLTRPSPFQSRDGEDVTDSLINVAAVHHKPSSFLQWVMATADQVASGFERTTFEQYNAASDDESFREARMLVRFEDYDGPGRPGRTTAPKDCHWRYDLLPLSPQALMPVAHDGPRSGGVRSYRALWEWLIGDVTGGVGRIPGRHRDCWPLWLDHFDTLWLTVAHAIPSATTFGVRSDVSLYDHSHATAALATALWRYHRQDDPEVARKRLAERDDRETNKFLLIEGDFSGIQDFIFGGEGITQKRAARMLRGRSTLVGLLSELAALALLEELQLPPTSQVINAAGHFQIVAPNTEDVQRAVQRIQRKLDGWFLKEMFGLGRIALATTPAACADFTDGTRFRQVTARLWRNLEGAKRHPFALASEGGPDAVLRTDFSEGPCPFDGRLPASSRALVAGQPAHPLSGASIELGKALTNPERQYVLIFREEEAPDEDAMLPGTYFGYRVLLTGEKEATNRFGAFAKSGRLCRAWDISLASADPQQVSWSGYARRPLSAYVPLHDHEPGADKRYDGLDAAERGALKTFGHLARDDQSIDVEGYVEGVEALGVLKGDIDDLGAFFEAQTARPSFAARAEMSRRIGAFFTIWVPSLLKREPKFGNIYTVFAGGDDFFFIGPWRTLRIFAKRLRDDFSRYVAGNPKLHFSAGYVMAKPGHPVRSLARDVDRMLDRAKTHGPENAKNAFALFDTAIPWQEWDTVVEEAIRALGHHVDTDNLSKAYLYGLLSLAEMAADNSRPENARWRSRLYYQTRRHFERSKIPKKEHEQRLKMLAEEIGARRLEKRPDGFRIALFDQLYARRK